MVRIPGPIWQGQVTRNARGARTRLAFMTADHHRVRDFVVRELPRFGGPLPPEQIAASLGLAPERVKIILAELEKGMTFLFRNQEDAVAWAYPVTADQTPHLVSFSTGEQVNAA